MKFTINTTVIFISLILHGCNLVRKDACNFDLSGIDQKLPVKIILSEFRFNGTTWETVTVDSIYTLKHSLTWPKKYDNAFIANFTVLNSRNIIVGFCNDFIYSNSGLNIKVDTNKKPLNVKGKYENAVSFKVEGGENNLYKNKDFLAPPNIKKPQSFLKDIKNNEHLKMKDQVFVVKWERYENSVLNEVKKYHKNYFTVYRLMDVSFLISNSTLEKCFNELEPKLKITNEGKFIRANIINTRRLYVGNKLFSFNVVNSFNQEFLFNKSLSKKYYLIDFWASWCVPCRNQMQEFKNLDNTIDTNKIQFISLSTDTKKVNWIKASQEENLKWPNYIQSEKSDQNLNTLFCLGYIPQNVLINSDGIIIDKNISIDSLGNFIRSKQLSIDNYKR